MLRDPSPHAGAMRVLILALVCPQGPNGPQGPTGFPGPKGPPVSTAFSLWGRPRVSRRRWSFPRAPASRLRLRGGWPAQELWLGGQFGAQGPLCHQTITTVQSALSQGGGTGPLKPQKRVLSPSGGQSPNSGAGARFLPRRPLPAPGPLGSWTLSPSACVFAWPSPLSSSVSRSLSLPWMKAQPNSARPHLDRIPSAETLFPNEARVAASGG